ncbi:hypothetical protein NDU88_002426 [Pleurodeles waltl]|uniref:Uncharacterized protein n=1 Tax=Pleurodeles waltl TaxID=8319 RepID=A0AAV7NGG6_PLEWA|nr:hypothetical protein NDU88_002426 [Pleurodeles waltl]
MTSAPKFLQLADSKFWEPGRRDYLLSLKSFNSTQCHHRPASYLTTPPVPPTNPLLLLSAKLQAGWPQLERDFKDDFLTCSRWDSRSGMVPYSLPKPTSTVGSGCVPSGTPCRREAGDALLPARTADTYTV